jgi:maltooligosyltrehalose trehalohydrolase
MWDRGSAWQRGRTPSDGKSAGERYGRSRSTFDFQAADVNGFGIPGAVLPFLPPPDDSRAEYAIADASALLRRLPIGAEVLPGRGVHFRVWAPECTRAEVVIESTEREDSRLSAGFALGAETDGYFSALVSDAAAGMLYRFRLDGGEALHPDPVSRFQPSGPDGPSQIVDPATFAWTDHDWQGRALEGQILYELHVGTFTPEGTWEAAARELPALAAAGITAVEVMPVAEFSGRFGWGYDGVDLFAPTRLYGTPDDFRRFVDRAHALGLAVLLDVVYNHFGPDGCHLKAYSRHYFTDRYDNEWGEAVNFDGEASGPVREFFVANARYWIEEFHLDGLRLDATQQMFDAGPDHVIAAIARAVRAAAGGRHTLIVCENEPQHTKLLRTPEAGGYGTDALWNDDFHHAAVVAVTGRNEAYYTDYLGTPQELVSLAKRGWLYQGQRYKWQGKRRGTPTCDVRPPAFVNYLENHDQIANSRAGARLHQVTTPGRYRAITALQLLSPGTPMLFQGQEFAASSPFLFFADHKPELADAVRKGRAEFLSQFPSIATAEARSALADPGEESTFLRCKLNPAERDEHREAYALHCDLIRLRREDPVFSAQGARGVDGAVLGQEAFVLRYFGHGSDDRLVLINLGRDLCLDVVPEPLLAPPEGCSWHVIWSSEDVRYGGSGTPPVETDAGWHVSGHAALVLAPQAAQVEDEGTLTHHGAQ